MPQQAVPLHYAHQAGMVGGGERRALQKPQLFSPDTIKSPEAAIAAADDQQVFVYQGRGLNRTAHSYLTGLTTALQMEGVNTTAIGRNVEVFANNAQ